MKWGALAVIFAASLWGLDGVVLRPMLYSLDVKVVVFLEHLIAFSFMAVALLFYERKSLKKIKAKEWLVYFGIALFGGAVGTMAITKALFLVNFDHISIILILQKLQPFFAIVLAWIILKEKPKKTFYLYACLAVFGSYLITYGFHMPTVQGTSIAFAAGFSLLAALSWGSSTVLGKFIVTRVSFQVSTYIRFGLTSVIMFLIIAATGFKGFEAVEVIHISRLFIIALTTGGLAIAIYYYGLRKIQASKATIYELSFPVTAVILDYAINGSLMSIGQGIGAILIIFSMIKISK